MKYKRLVILICASILSAAGSLSAQTRYNIDTDILALRNNVLPEFRWHYDDYLQYAPAAVMLGIKASDPAGGGRHHGAECLLQMHFRLPQWHWSSMV